jgi:hypothetical protein
MGRAFSELLLSLFIAVIFITVIRREAKQYATRVRANLAAN